MQGKVISLYLDHPTVGCGWRQYLVLEVGRKFARLICTENAEPMKIDATLLRSAKAVEFKPRRLAKRLRHVALTYHREDSWALKRARRLLAAMPARQVAP